MAASSPGSSKSPWWRCRARIAPVVCSWHWGRACCCGRPPRTSASTMGRGWQAGRKVGSTEGGGGRGGRFGVGRGVRVDWVGFGIAKRFCWTPDQRGLIFGDTLANTLYCADYRADWADQAEQDGGGVLGQRRI